MSATERSHGDSRGPEASPEPRTPMWLPALGGVLLLTVGLIWGLSAPDEPPHESAPSGAASAAADAGAPQTR